MGPANKHAEKAQINSSIGIPFHIIPNVFSKFQYFSIKPGKMGSKKSMK